MPTQKSLTHLWSVGLTSRTCPAFVAMRDMCTHDVRFISCPKCRETDAYLRAFVAQAPDGKKKVVYTDG